MTLKDKRIEWKARFDAWKESEQSVAEWCRDHDVKVATMYYWVKQLSQDTKPVETTQMDEQWLSVQVDEDTNIPHAMDKSIFIHLDDIAIEVQTGTNAKLLSNVIHVLRNQC